MKKHILYFFVLIYAISLGQISPQKIEIIRDQQGVPHIFAETDAEVAYGLAWAHAEDNFKDIQHSLLYSKKKLGILLGKEGVAIDYLYDFFQIDSIVESRYNTDLSPEFKKVLAGYISGINAYATKHPNEVLIPEAFPFTEKDIIKGYTLNLLLMAGGGMALKSIRERRIDEFFSANDIGSNAMAVSPKLSEDGKTWLLVNSHQPLEGRVAWYEAHVQSKEGWNMLGGIFPGGVSIFVGTNENLGWAHTVNYHTFGDLYKLKVRGKKYYLNEKWVPFVTEKAKLKVKLKGIKLSITKKILRTVFGPVMKNKDGYYALRLPGAYKINAAEQWFRMNKSKNLEEFTNALKMEALPLFNVVYADKNGNILLHSGMLIPQRNPDLNWKQPLDGTKTTHFWNSLLPFDKKPWLLNPDCGYVQNCNQTPLLGSGDGCQWVGSFPGLQQFTYNRGSRLKELMDNHKGKLSWNDFQKYKFDKSYSQNGIYAQKFKALYTLDEKKYPKLADAIQIAKKWNFDGNASNQQAALLMITHNFMTKKTKGPFAILMTRKENVSEKLAVDALKYAKKQLLKTHGTLELPLGNVLKLHRGNVAFPLGGQREVLRAADPKLYDKKRGLYKTTGGDGYMQMNKYSTQGVEIWSVNAFGASSHPESKHYTDQMETFANEKFYIKTLKKDEILKEAESVYHPE